MCLNTLWHKQSTNIIITNAGIAAGEGTAFRCICLSVCPHSNKKMAWAINTKFGTCILYIAVARHALTQRSKGQKSRSHTYENRHGRTIASDLGRYSVHLYAAVLLAAIAGMGLHVDTTTYVYVST